MHLFKNQGCMTLRLYTLRELRRGLIHIMLLKWKNLPGYFDEYSG